MYKDKRNYCNIGKAKFDGCGIYEIPEIEPTQWNDVKDLEWIPFHYAKTVKKETRFKKGIHFFIDDYQFERLWNKPDYYIPLLKQFRTVLSPDFSLYDDFPEAIKIYNHYRKHWLGAYMQQAGIQVIPTIAWGSYHTFNWCFDGEPIGGSVAVSSVGCIRGKAEKELFLAGYNEMLERLNPQKIFFSGIVPDGIDKNIILPIQGHVFGRDLDGR